MARSRKKAARTAPADRPEGDVAPAAAAEAVVGPQSDDRPVAGSQDQAVASNSGPGPTGVRPGAGAGAAADGDEDEEKARYTGHRHSFAAVRDSEYGIRVEREFERRPGQNDPQVLIRFREKPPAEVLEIVKAEGWEFKRDANAWAKPATAANLLLAKRTVNAVLKHHGSDAQLFL